MHARGHRLPDVHASLGDDAIDRRGDDGVFEIDLRLVEVGLRLSDGRLCRIQCGLRWYCYDDCAESTAIFAASHISLRREALRVELLGPRVSFC